MDAASVMIWTSGPDKLCTWFNRPWLNFTGRAMEQELGNGWAQTGYSRNAIVHQGRLDRGVEVIQKPIAQDALAVRVRELIDRPRR